MSLFSASAIAGMKHYFRADGPWWKEQERRDSLGVRFNADLGIDEWPTQTKAERSAALAHERIMRSDRRRRLEEYWPTHVARLLACNPKGVDIEAEREDYFDDYDCRPMVAGSVDAWDARRKERERKRSGTYTEASRSRG